jgi:hypothetical protein
MYELKKTGKVRVFTSKFVGNGPLSYEKRIYQAVVSTKVEKHWSKAWVCGCSLARIAVLNLSGGTDVSLL